MAAEEFVVDVKGLYPDFESLIADKRNERILFSARFGTGKTYFLERFFSDQKDKYVAVRLFPVNYSVSSNEDIFRLIKFDILYELVKAAPATMHPRPLNPEYAAVAAFQSLMGRGKLESVVSILTKLTAGALSALNKDASVAATDAFDALTNSVNVIKAVRSAAKDYFKEYEKLREGNSHLEEVESFWEDVEDSHLLEIDFITQFIIDSLEALAGDGAERRRKVLIIDDLDRLDPEHLFRLFNIFSAHFDYRKAAGNKFGFDHVIFVGDLANIHSLFAARYGEKTDRSGYLDKFYSTEPYHFDNGEMVAGAMQQVLKTLDLGNYPNIKQSLLKTLFHGSLPVEAILREMAYGGSFTLRRVVSIRNRQLPLKQRELPLRFEYGDGVTANFQLVGVMVLEVLYWLFGDSATLRRALQQTANREALPGMQTWRNEARSGKIADQKMLLQYMLPIADEVQFGQRIQQKRYGSQDDPLLKVAVVFTSPNTGKQYQYQPWQALDGTDSYFGKVERIHGLAANSCQPTESLGGFDVMLCAFDKLMELGYFLKA